MVVATILETAMGKRLLGYVPGDVFKNVIAVLVVIVGVCFVFGLM